MSTRLEVKKREASHPRSANRIGRDGEPTPVAAVPKPGFQGGSRTSWTGKAVYVINLIIKSSIHARGKFSEGRKKPNRIPDSRLGI